MNLSDKVYRPNAVHGAISRGKNDGQSAQTFKTESYWDEVVKRIYEGYQQKLQNNNALDFDDLLLLTSRLFQEVPSVLESYRRRWQYLHVDEFQDTNLVQYDLVRLLGARARQCVCGGRRRSGDLRLARRGSPQRAQVRGNFSAQARIIALEQNYRSTQTILDAASELIRCNRNRKDKGLWSELGQGMPIVVFEAYDEGEEAQYIVREIQRLKAREGYRNRDFALLYRTNAQSRALEEAFVRSGLTYVIVGGTRFYERREVKDVMAYVRLLHNPFDSVSLERIINVPTRGIGDVTFRQLTEWAASWGLPAFTALQLLEGQVEGAEGELSALLPPVPPPFMAAVARRCWVLPQLQPILQSLDTMNLPMMIGEIVERIGYEGFLRDGTPEGEDRWANVIELQNVATQYEHLSATRGAAGVPGKCRARQRHRQRAGR